MERLRVRTIDLRSLVVVLILLSTGSAPALAACEPIVIDGQSYDGDSVVVSTVVAADTVHLAGCDFHHGELFGYDKTAGGKFSVRGTDVYTLMGPPPGTQVQLRFGVKGSFSSDQPDFEPNCACKTHAADILVTMQNSFGAVDTFHTCLCGNIGLDMSRYVELTVGQDFTLEYQMAGSDSADGTHVEGHVSIYIEGITPEMQLVSCHGILREVRALASSWGALKARYR
jgi:hypothetical protein